MSHPNPASNTFWDQPRAAASSRRSCSGVLSGMRATRSEPWPHSKLTCDRSSALASRNDRAWSLSSSTVIMSLTSVTLPPRRRPAAGGVRRTRPARTIGKADGLRTRTGLFPGQCADEHSSAHGGGDRPGGRHHAAPPHALRHQARDLAGRLRPDDRLLPPPGGGPAPRAAHGGPAHSHHRAGLLGDHLGHLVPLHRRLARAGRRRGRRPGPGRVPGLLLPPRAATVPPATEWMFTGGACTVAIGRGGGRWPGGAPAGGGRPCSAPRRPSPTPSPPG